MRVDAKLGILIGACLAGIALWYYWGEERPDQPIDYGPLKTAERPASDESTASIAAVSPEPASRLIPAPEAPTDRPTPAAVDLSQGAPEPEQPAAPDLRPVVVPEPAEPKASRHTIQSGENFAKLAQQYYGSQGEYYVDLIVQANATLDPQRLKIGMTVVIPPLPDPTVPQVEPAAKDTATLTRSYRVRTGDSFYMIAQRLCGNGSRWREMYDLNKDRIGNNPAGLKPGQVLRLPSDWPVPPR